MEFLEKKMDLFTPDSRNSLIQLILIARTHMPEVVNFIMVAKCNILFSAAWLPQKVVGSCVQQPQENS